MKRRNFLGAILGLMVVPFFKPIEAQETKGKLIEFEKGNGIQFKGLNKYLRGERTWELTQRTVVPKAIRFTPQQIVHVQIGDTRKTFYPYGVSIL